MSVLLALTLCFAPAYAVRFGFFGLPANWLMIWIIILWLFFLINFSFGHHWQAFFSWLKKKDKKILTLISLLFAAGFISLFINGLTIPKLGQFLVLFFQPISLYFLFGFSADNKEKKWFVDACYLLLALAGVYAILQYFTLIGLPSAYWGNSAEPKRALSFFTHPNFYALFAAPLLAFLVPDLIASLKIKKNNSKLLFWLLGSFGLLLSMSRAGWLGLTAAILIYLFVAADKKIRRNFLLAALALIIIALCIPNLRYRLTLPLYGEKSAVSRLSLWHTGWKGITEAPLTGLGLTGFSNQWATLNTDPNLDTHNYPHNIFLDVWVETGILGLISFAGLMIIVIYRGIKNRDDILQLSVSLFLIAMLCQGLIDNPYFKNDLALVFWLILSLVI